MTRVAVLEISDLALTLFRGDQLVHSEPCFATYDGQWQFGQTAQYQQRKKPRESESKYFARLNTDPLTQPLGGVRHYADLVFLQLKALHAQFEKEYTHLYLIPPAHYSREQRSLLLGISETAALPVAGFIEPGLLPAAADEHSPGDHILLDIGHSSVTAQPFSQDAGGASVSTGQALVISDRGLSQMVEGLMAQAAEALIKQERFDPLRKAETEQQLFDGALAYFAGDLAISSPMTIRHDDGEHRLPVTETMIRAATGRTITHILGHLAEDSVPTILSHRLGKIPGLADQLRLSSRQEVIFRTFPALGAQFLAVADQFVTSESGQQFAQLRRVNSENQPKAVLTREKATHLLDGYHALAIGEKTSHRLSNHGFTFVKEGADLSIQPANGLLLNDTPIESPQVIYAGDRITIGSDSLLAITLVQ